MKLNGYERRTKAKKESIVNAARKLFTTRGITDVSIKEIAAKANVSQVTIYNIFGSKNALQKKCLFLIWIWQLKSMKKFWIEIFLSLKS